MIPPRAKRTIFGVCGVLVALKIFTPQVLPSFLTFNRREIFYEFPSQKIPGVPYWYYNPTSESLNFTENLSKEETVNITGTDGKKQFKIILFWNDFFKNDDYGFGLGHTPFKLAGCPVNKCVVTADRDKYPLKDVDALIWHVHSSKRELPKIRYPHTRYVFYIMEPPFRTWVDLKKYKDVFNMTFTYRRDADIYYPHDRVFLRPRPLPESSTNYAEGKKKMAAQFVSNCGAGSGRKELVEELQKLMPVDVYGRCGTLRCALSNQSECMKMVERDYKFYFAFENSLCKDYASYKLFRALRINVVPVVYGLANYSAIAPPHSVINALDFNTAADLGKYLLYLNSNDTAYNEYFRWKRYYYHKHPWMTDAMAYCDLCEQLHKDLPPKTYDINKWWRIDAECKGTIDPRVKSYLQLNDTKKT